MKRLIQRHSGDDSQASQALADIALNTLGLILIVLLIYMLLFQQASQQLAQAESTPSTSNATIEGQLRETQSLREQVEQLKEREKQRSRDSQDSGLWQFRIHVTGLVDHDGQTESADWNIIYFVHLAVAGHQVSGTLFGVREDHEQDDVNSASHADILGTMVDGSMEIELAFTGQASGASERLILTKRGEEYVGALHSGRTKPGAVNYSGPARGSRLQSSVFAY